MQIRSLKYLMAFTTFALTAVALSSQGWWTWVVPIYAFGLVPLVELLMQPDPHNLDEAERELVKQDRMYDYMVWAMVPLQWGLLVWFCFAVGETGLGLWEQMGRTWSMGIACGVMGINVAHELGHRITWYEKLMAKALLLTSLYMHFFIEHNRGHHMRVSTPEDPASARRGEIVYGFWLRSMWQSYLSAWNLENSRLRKKGHHPISWRNEMLIYQLLQVGLVLAIGLLFSWATMGLFLFAALIGMLLLETVNYIEHYGLQRQKDAHGRYERVQPEHSWNSNHPYGRLLLFELSRHSDHHYRAGRKYQVLRHMEGAPQMPTGYPGMMVLSLLPPLWFAVMHRQIERYHGSSAAQAPA